MVRSKLVVPTLALVALFLGPQPPVETVSTTVLQVQVAQALRVTAVLGVHAVDLDTGETVPALPLRLSPSYGVGTQVE